MSTTRSPALAPVCHLRTEAPSIGAHRRVFVRTIAGGIRRAARVENRSPGAETYVGPPGGAVSHEKLDSLCAEGCILRASIPVTRHRSSLRSSRCCAFSTSPIRSRFPAIRSATWAECSALRRGSSPRSRSTRRWRCIRCCWRRRGRPRRTACPGTWPACCGRSRAWCKREKIDVVLHSSMVTASLTPVMRARHPRGRRDRRRGARGARRDAAHDRLPVVRAPGAALAGRGVPHQPGHGAASACSAGCRRRGCTWCPAAWTPALFNAPRDRRAARRELLRAIGESPADDPGRRAASW